MLVSANVARWFMTKQPAKPKRAGLDDARNTFAYGV
jgi:hypothetical protein